MCSMFYQPDLIKKILLDCDSSVGYITSWLKLIHFWNIDEIYGDGLLNPSQSGDYQLGCIYTVYMPHIPPLFEANSDVVEAYVPSGAGDKQLDLFIIGHATRSSII